MGEKKRSSKSEGISQKTVLKIIMGVTLAGFLVCVGVIVSYYMALQAQQKKYAELAATMEKQVLILNQAQSQSQSQTDNQTQQEDTETVVEEVQEYISPVDFTKLREEENGHIYAWIQVEGTKINYPVVQHPTDVSFYLTHNLDGSKGYPGCIYTEKYNREGFVDPVTVVYGHYMKDGSMFTGLHKFKDATFFEENDTITIYLPEEKIEYQVLAAHMTDDKRLTVWYDFSDETVLQNYIEEILAIEESETDHVRRDLDVSAQDQFIVLQTCVDESKDSRYAVIAVKKH